MEKQKTMQDQDQSLMQRVANGEEAAVAELYDRFGPLVFKVAHQLLPTRAEAEDAVQDVFVRLWKTADRYDQRRAKLVTWVMLITRRHVIDRLRRKRARPKTTTIDGDLTRTDKSAQPDVPPQILERNSALMQKIEDLSELQQVVIERAYLQGFTLREISEQLDIPLGTIKSALSRGLKQLRDRTQADLTGT